jgi:dTDP-4-amino-4,6-dideoxygalactose transaminase
MLRLNLDRLELDRGEFIDELRRQGIGTSVHFIPIPLHPFFAAAAELKQNSCPAALALYPRLVSLPLYPAMTESQVEQVAGAVKTIAQNARRKKVAAAVMDGR